MSHTIHYKTDTFMIPDALIPGNEASTTPVSFDVEPAWGPDLARLKSVIYAVAAVSSPADWDGNTQDAVIRAFQTGKSAFVNAVGAIHNLFVPARMAWRAGLTKDEPVDPNGTVAITSGLAFSQICTASPMVAISLLVATKIVQMSDAPNTDARFFVQPSGSGGPAMPEARTGNAAVARRRSRRRATAASGSQKTAKSPARTDSTGPGSSDPTR